VRSQGTQIHVGWGKSKEASLSKTTSVGGVAPGDARRGGTLCANSQGPVQAKAVVAEGVGTHSGELLRQVEVNLHLGLDNHKIRGRPYRPAVAEGEHEPAHGEQREKRVVGAVR